MIQRCDWVTMDPLYLAYHDHEWGKPLQERNRLFEMLCLEGQQAGLSWITVLKKRENYRRAFCQFTPEQVALITEQTMDQHMQDSGLIRNYSKLTAIVANAHALLAMEAAGEDFVTFLWSYVDNQPIVNHYPGFSDIPTQSIASQSLSAALKKRGFKFVGPTICYAFMQACGFINDHQTNCFCHPGNAT